MYNLPSLSALTETDVLVGVATGYGAAAGYVLAPMVAGRIGLVLGGPVGAGLLGAAAGAVASLWDGLPWQSVLTTAALGAVYGLGGVAVGRLLGGAVNPSLQLAGIIGTTSLATMAARMDGRLNRIPVKNIGNGSPAVDYTGMSAAMIDMWMPDRDSPIFPSELSLSDTVEAWCHQLPVVFGECWVSFGDATRELPRITPPVLEDDPAELDGTATTIDAYKLSVEKLNQTFEELQRAEVALAKLVKHTGTISSQAREVIDATVEGLSRDAKTYPPGGDEDRHVVDYSEKHLAVLEDTVREAISRYQAVGQEINDLTGTVRRLATLEPVSRPVAPDLNEQAETWTDHHGNDAQHRKVPGDTVLV